MYGGCLFCPLYPLLSRRWLMKPDFFVSHATSKTFKIVVLTVKETFFSENPIIGTAAKLQYKFPSLRTRCYGHYLMVSWSRDRLHRESGACSVMVSFYGYEIWRHMAKIMKSAYLCVIFHVKHTISRGFNLIFNSWWNPRWRPRWRPLLVTSRIPSSATTHKIYLIL